MKADSHRVCPACQTRNKPAWEFCARCGESLQGVPLAGETPETEEVAEERPLEPAAPSLGFYASGMLALAAAGAFAWWWTREERVTRPDPAFFAPPTKSVPSMAPRYAAGEKAFLEGRTLLLKGDRAGAVKLLAQAVSEAPQSAQYRTVYAEALEATGSKDEALRQLTLAVDMDPKNVTPLWELARALDRANRTQDATRRYEALLSARPDNAQVLKEAASLYSRTGNASRAAALLREAVRHSSDLLVKQEFGQALEEAGDREGAAAVYDEVLQQRPDAHITRGLLAEIRLQQGRVDEAVGVFKAGLSLNPNAPLLHRGLASLLERSGRLGEAAAEYREYARLAPNAPDAKKLATRAAWIERRAASS